jgi:uncharacterized protein (TIGR01777 family)
MRDLVTGGTGALGRRLVAARLAAGDAVEVVTRRPGEARGILPPGTGVVAGDPTLPGAWQSAVDGVDAVVHLAGAGVADRRWTEAYRDEIESSRIDSAHQVMAAIAEAARPPRILVSASAVGLYGDRGEETLDERSRAGHGFMSEVCLRWEREAMKAAELPTPVRVAIARIGIVLDPEAGFLARVLPYFRRGLGAVFGPGTQWVPWIHHADCTAILSFLLDREVSGPVNVVGPRPTSARQVAHAIAAAVGRPALLSVPSVALRLSLGEVADTLLASRKVVPARMLEAGFVFRHQTVEGAVAAAVREAIVSTPQVEAPRAQLPRPVEPPERPRFIVMDRALLEAPDAREALLAASIGGAQVVVASSRRGPDLLAGVPETLHPLPAPVAIAANGAVLWSFREAKAVRAERLDAATLEAIVRSLRTLVPHAAMLFEGEDWLAADRPVPGRTLDLRLGPGELPPRPSVRLHVLGDRETLAVAGKAIETPFWRDRKVTLFVRDGSLEVAAPLVDRAIALQRLAKSTAVRRDAIVAILSDDDDLGLAEWCGYSLAAPSAPARVRRLASAALEADLDPAAALRPVFARLGFH